MRSLLGDLHRDLITLASDATVAREWETASEPNRAELERRRAGAPRFPVLFDNQVIVLDSAMAAEAAQVFGARRVLPATATAGPISPRAETN
jgi:hypothetical protein